MPLMITPRGKLEEVNYSAYEKLQMALMAATRKFRQLIDRRTALKMAAIRRKKVE